MFKLNKCRTLFEFSEASLASMQKSGQTVEANLTIPGGQKTQEEKPETQIIKSLEQVYSDSLNQGYKKDYQAEEQEEKEKQEDDVSQKIISERNIDINQKELKKESQDDTYLFFCPDEFVITTYKNENGWWYGYIENNKSDSKFLKMGYFPSTYVQVIEIYDEQTEDQEEKLTASINTDEACTWANYAKNIFLNDNRILMEERQKKMDDAALENQNSDFIKGYRTIKVHESRSHAVNPWKGGKVQTSQVAIKDQTPLAKAYRQMNHYFDYDAWIEERNKAPAPKALPDPTKKKLKKKVLDW